MEEQEKENYELEHLIKIFDRENVSSLEDAEIIQTSHEQWERIPQERAQDESNNQQGIIPFDEVQCLTTIGLKDRLVVTISFKFPGYKEFELDAQIYTGSMISWAKFKALPEYIWKPFETFFKAINPKLVRIKHKNHP